MLESTGVFRHSLSVCKGLPLEQVKVRDLKNTVWKTPFGTVRSLPQRGDKRALLKHALSSLPDFWPRGWWVLLSHLTPPFHAA